jgi:hypothetical protein
MGFGKVLIIIFEEGGGVMQITTDISKFVSCVFRYDTNNLSGYLSNSYEATVNGQCQSNCCTKEMER